MKLYQISILIEADDVSEEAIKQMENYGTECTELGAKILGKTLEEITFILAAVAVSQEEPDEEVIVTPSVD